MCLFSKSAVCLLFVNFFCVYNLLFTFFQLLGETATDWKAIRGVIIRDNFISSIVSFNTDDITDDIREKMKSKYLSNPDFTFEKVNRASLACGPLVKWAIAQLMFADMLKRIEPLRYLN